MGAQEGVGLEALLPGKVVDVGARPGDAEGGPT